LTSEQLKQVEQTVKTHFSPEGFYTSGQWDQIETPFGTITAMLTEKLRVLIKANNPITKNQNNTFEVYRIAQKRNKQRELKFDGFYTFFEEVY
jgi:hypothetical protein